MAELLPGPTDDTRGLVPAGPDSGPEPGAPPPPAPEPAPEPSILAPDDPRLQRLRRINRQPWNYQAPPLFNPADVTPLDLARPVLHFGMGLGEGVVATIRKARTGMEPTAPEFRDPLEALGYGFLGPQDPNDPLVAAGMAFPPGSAVARGLELAGSLGPKLAAPTLREARFAAAQSRYMPDFARLSVAGIPDVAGAAEIPRRLDIISGEEALRSMAAKQAAFLESEGQQLPPEVARFMGQAQAIVERDQPGLVTSTLNTLPGTKQVVQHFEPALKLPPEVTASWVADGRAQTATAAKLQLALRSQLDQLDAAFGKNATALRDYKPVGIAFKGTAEQAQYPWAGTLADMLARPSLYELTPEQTSAIAAVQQARSGAFNTVKNAFGLDIGEFPIKEGLFLPNIDISEDAVQAAGGQRQVLMQGRAKERFYANAAERWAHDNTFQPETNVRALLQADDSSLAQMAGKNTFVLGSGGKTRLDLMEELHPELYTKMQSLQRRVQNLKASAATLQRRQAEAIDTFLTSNVEDADLENLQRDLEPIVRRGSQQGQNIPQVQQEIAGVRLQIDALRPAWRTANTKPYALVDLGGPRRYFPADQAGNIRDLVQRSNSPLWRWSDELRQTAFGGDLSPISIQGLLAWMSDPAGASQSAWAQKMGAFSEADLVRDMQARPDVWQRFIEYTGINPLGSIDQEFGTGFLSKVPKVGKIWENWNESLYRPLMRYQNDLFEASYQGALKRGLTAEQAGAVAADDATKLVPRMDYRRLGQSQAQAAHYRTVMTSVSFLTQPTALMSDATKGLVKLGTKQTLTPNEVFAVKRVLTLAATTEAITVASNTWYARQHGLDENQAVKDALNPDSGSFMSLRLPNGGKIGLGGPYRAIVRAVAPNQIGGQGPYLPFAGLVDFAEGKIGPGLRIALDEARNRDYYGNQIRTGDKSLPGFALNLLQGTAYVFQGAAPLTIGTTVQTARQGQPLSETAAQGISQFAGTNYTPETLRQLENRVAVQMFPIDPKKEPWRQQEPYLGLTPAQQEKVRQDPLVKEQWQAQQAYQGKSFEAWRGAEAQFHDTVRRANEAADDAYKGLAGRRQATIDGKLTGDNALSPEQFREAIKDTARARRQTVLTATEAWDKWAQKYPKKDFEELNPDAALREKFLAEYNDLSHLDLTTLAWNYPERDAIKAAWEGRYDPATVRRWLREGSEKTPPLVQRYWDGLEKYRDYFKVQDEAMAHVPQQTREWLLALQELETQRQEPGRVEALKRMAPPEVAQWQEAITQVKHAMRAGNPELDRWLFDYGYTPSTMAEQLTRKAS